MRICGLITEYNPFHQGHRIHMEEAKQRTKADYYLAIMSGNFVQRGEPAIFDKFSRARCAVQNGVDLVVELPTVYATASAGSFAFGAVSILNELKLVTDLCFGSKTEDVNLFYKVSELVSDESPEFKRILKLNLKKGTSYPLARATAVQSIIPEIPSEFLKDANTLLGIEYFSSLQKINSSILPHTYIRKPGFQASDIRKGLWEEGFDSSNSDCGLTGSGTALMKSDDFSSMLQYRMLFSSFENIYGMTPDLYRKILKSKDLFFGFEDLVEDLKTKNITRTHIKRALIHTLLNITSEDMHLFHNKIPCYIRVLSCSTKGRNLLQYLSKACKLPIITSPKQRKLIKDQASLRSFDIDRFASELYYTASTQKYPNRINEYRKNPFSLSN